jgi:hypothetical protein
MGSLMPNIPTGQAGDRPSVCVPRKLAQTLLCPDVEQCNGDRLLGFNLSLYITKC